MKINFIINWNWPLDIQCECGCNFSPEIAEDIKRVKSATGEKYVTCCPICEEVHYIETADIPVDVREKADWLPCPFRQIHED